MPRKAKKGSPRYYFTQDTENAIIRHNKETRPHMRERIYNEHIRTAFEKLAENIIHTFKFYYFDVPSEDVKNYLILHNNNNYKKMKNTDQEDAGDYKRDPISEANHKDLISAKKEYMDLFVDYWTNNLTTVFKRKQDIDVANAVIYLIEKRENIENFNKKALYIMIREMTNSNTQHITRVVNVMKKHHYNLQKNYLTTGSIETKWTGSWDNL